MLLEVNEASEEFIFVVSESAEIMAEVAVAGESRALKSTCGLGSLAGQTCVKLPHMVGINMSKLYVVRGHFL